jgi:mediator of RNA polymerase II transcription subunit 16
MAWLVDSLLHPEDTSLFEPLATGQSIDLDKFHARLRDSNNVALHLLLSSAPRVFLTAICRRVTNLDYTARKAMLTAAQSQAGAPIPIPPPLTSSALRAAYTSIATLTSNSVIQYRAFEAFLTSISASVKDAYTTAGLTSSTPQTQPQQQPHSKDGISRNAAEQTMLFGGPPPAALVPAMRHIFTTLLPTLHLGIDPAKLFFSDFSLLALDPITPSTTHSPSPAPPEQTLASLLGPDQQKGKRTADLQRIAHTIDIFQRVPITLGQEAVDGPVNENGVREKVRDGKRWRRCVRCTAVMEDYLTQRPGVHVLVIQEKRCFCNGTWNLLTGKQIVI